MTVSVRKIKIYLCALAGIFSMNPYFVWPTFMGGVLSYTTYILYGLAIIYFINESGGIRLIRKKDFLGVVLLFVLYGISYIHSYTETGVVNLVAGFLLFLYLICYAIVDESYKSMVFDAFVKIFVISMIPGLIYFVFERCGVSLSIGTLQSTNQIVYEQSREFLETGLSGYYKLYVGAVMRVNSNTRFAGIYDEAGLVGTVAALCLIGRGVALKKDKWCRWLLFFLVLSFSLAGYILLIAYYFLSALRKKQWKIFVGTAVLLTFLVVLSNISSTNPMINNLQSRISITSTGITIKNNRETSKFDMGYSMLTEGSLSEKMFGFGKGAAVNEYMNGSSSYKNKIFEYGYVGFGLMIFTLVLLYRNNLKHIWMNNWSQFVLLIIFMISIYQRPSVYFPFYFIILYGGGSYLTYKEDDYASY